MDFEQGKYYWIEKSNGSVEHVKVLTNMGQGWYRIEASSGTPSDLPTKIVRYLNINTLTSFQKVKIVNNRYTAGE